MHKRDGAHSATRLGPLWTLKSLFFLPCSLYFFTSTTESMSLLKSAGDTAETAAGTEEQSEKMSVTVEDWQTDRLTDRGTKTIYVLVDMVI